MSLFFEGNMTGSLFSGPIQDYVSHTLRCLCISNCIQETKSLGRSSCGHACWCCNYYHWRNCHHLLVHSIPIYGREIYPRFRYDIDILLFDFSLIGYAYSLLVRNIHCDVVCANLRTGTFPSPLACPYCRLVCCLRAHAWTCLCADAYIVTILSSTLDRSSPLGSFTELRN